ncbi:hypothetical protein RF11_11450 [Thelohanellus kitauei]|uniref:Uncharacterized protein n=1 Tax=Thelohanellus kitauei TaxID=669202 RepID=A0A0C2MVU3_THEKT|nr:hypothetical protein RF11_11450 [Thelohanellus kitauei]
MSTTISWTMGGFYDLSDNLKEDINKAIQRCAEYGHHCRKDLSDAQKGEEFFNEADELRHKYILSHTCVRTLFDPSEFDEDLNKAYAEKIKVDFKLIQVL